VSGEEALTESVTDCPLVLFAEVGGEEIIGEPAPRIVKLADARVMS
jgi:hypothetical protein